MRWPPELCKTWVRVEEEDDQGYIIYVELRNAPKGLHRDILNLMPDGQFTADIDGVNGEFIKIVYGTWHSTDSTFILTLKPGGNSDATIHWLWTVLDDRLLLAEID